MSTLKGVWITPHDAGLVSLSMESEIVYPEYMRIKVSEREFPDNPTKKSPKRHTISVKLLTIDDLKLLKNIIDEYLQVEGEW